VRLELDGVKLGLLSLVVFDRKNGIFCYKFGCGKVKFGFKKFKIVKAYKAVECLVELKKIKLKVIVGFEFGKDWNFSTVVL
jgi:hypothetical protein